MPRPSRLSSPSNSTAVPSRRSGHDAARTTDENRRHWSNVDALAPVSQLTPAVRKTLRDRARYECLNNSYMAGAVRTLVLDTVGTGARLQMLTDDAALNANIEDLWRVWSAAVDWPLESRVACGVRYVSGECFGILTESKRLDDLGIPVPLRVRLIEPDQVTHGINLGSILTTNGDDGIDCDEEGDPVAYHLLKSHPGDHRAFVGRFETQKIPAANVLHWFIPERPGQLRGVTPFAASLPIFAQLRRFTQATLTAAEIAAMLAGIIEQPDVPAPDGSPGEALPAMDTVEMVRGMLLTLPPGAKATQFKPEQPTTNYDMFVNAKLRECGRAVCMPFGKIAGDHSRYNYSSGRMDDAPYWDDRDCERQALEAKFFDPVFYRFLDFARFVIPKLATFQGKYWQLKHAWHYRAKPSSDPVKDANGDLLNLSNGTDTLAAIAARDGTDWEALLNQRARERDAFESRGLPYPQWLTGGATPPADQPTQADAQPQPEGAANGA